MVMSFAHGANDVANAMGPFSAVYSIYSSGALTKDSGVPIWILVLGALLTWSMPSKVVVSSKQS